MSVTVRISYRWNYRGRRSGNGYNHTCNDMDHARNLCRKVIREHREFEESMKAAGLNPNKRTRNSGAQVAYLSVKPEGTKPGDIIDAWEPSLGWHKARVMSNGLAKAIEKEN